MPRLSKLFFIIGTILVFFPAHLLVAEENMSAEDIVKECEQRTGFKATDRGARSFIFRRCVQTIQTEKKHQTLAETKAIHRKNLQTRARTSFDRRGTGDRTLLRSSRPQRSRGVQRVYKNQTQFESIQFNRARSPDVPETPKEQKIQRAKVDASLDRYQMKTLSDACGNLSGLRKDICIRSQLRGGSARRWTKESRQH